MRQASTVLNSQIKIHAWFNSVNWRRMEAGRVKPPFEPDPHAVYAKVITRHLSLITCRLSLVTCQLSIVTNRERKKGIFDESQCELSHLVIHNVFLQYFPVLPPKIFKFPASLKFKRIFLSADNSQLCLPR